VNAFAVRPEGLRRLVSIRSPETAGDRRAPAWSREEQMKQIIRDFLKDESGASLIEYVLIGGIISIVGITVMTQIGGDISKIWDAIKGSTAKGVPPAP
jgi:pilus assembly protein Flp/PilA